MNEIKKKNRRRQRFVNINDPSVEKQERVCKHCNKTFIRYKVGMFDAFNKRYITEDGSTCNGNSCSACHKSIMKDAMKKKRAAKDIENLSHELLSSDIPEELLNDLEESSESEKE